MYPTVKVAFLLVGCTAWARRWDRRQGGSVSGHRLCDLARGHRSLRYEAGRSARAVGEPAPSACGFCGGVIEGAIL